ncbi:MAG: PIG-L family deacetylase, partial [Rhodospirillales bacterium]
MTDGSPLEHKRILILAPHPDDEVVGCGAAVRRARKAGASVYVIFLTNGVPAPHSPKPGSVSDYQERVVRRRNEAMQVADTMGFTPVGFPNIPSRNLKGHFVETREAIVRAVERYGIGALWAPAYEGGHQDHDAANVLASTFGSSLNVYEFAEYNFSGASVQCNAFPEPDGREHVLFLTPAEQERKRALLACYRSERSNLAFARMEQECFRPLPEYDYAKPPH